MHKTMRFSELQRHMYGITQKMFTNQLRSLEKYGLVERKVYPVVPPKVEYILSPRGKSLETVLLAMKNWEINQQNRIEYKEANK